MKNNEASSTAFSVLLGILFTARNPDLQHLVTADMKEASEEIVRFFPNAKKRLDKFDYWWYRSAVRIAEKALLPGITLHYVLRKNYIEKQVVEAINSGATQVINLGAGFDTLAMRLSKKHPDVVFIEVDHPATHNFKKQALENQLAKSTNLHLLAVDFNEKGLEETLAVQPYFSPEKNSIFIIEGVLMYLDESTVRDLFATLRQLTHSKHRVVITAKEPAGSDVYSDGPLLKLYLGIKKESYNWRISHHDIPAFLESVNYSTTEVATASTLGQLFLENYTKKLHAGAYLATIESNPVKH